MTRFESSIFTTATLWGWLGWIWRLSVAALMLTVGEGAWAQAQTFSPTEVPGLALWLDASDGATLFDAVSGGNPVSDGGAVARWEDKSGNGNHATQNEINARPSLAASAQNGLSALGYDGNDDGMVVAHDFSLNIAGGGTLLYVIRQSSGFRILQKAPSSDAIASGGYFAADGSGGLSVAGGYAQSMESNQDIWHLRSSVWSGTALSYWDNGLRLTPTSANNATISGGSVIPNSAAQNNTEILTLGYRSYNGGTGWMQGEMGELLLFSRALTDLERGAAEGYLAAKWDMGVTHSVSIASTVGGSADWEAASPFIENTSFTLTATPEAGYVFTGWTGSGIEFLDNPSALSVSVTVSGEMALVANFDLAENVAEQYAEAPSDGSVTFTVAAGTSFGEVSDSFTLGDGESGVFTVYATNEPAYVPSVSGITLSSTGNTMSANASRTFFYQGFEIRLNAHNADGTEGSTYRHVVDVEVSRAPLFDPVAWYTPEGLASLGLAHGTYLTGWPDSSDHGVTTTGNGNVSYQPRFYSDETNPLLRTSEPSRTSGMLRISANDYLDVPTGNFTDAFLMTVLTAPAGVETEENQVISSTTDNDAIGFKNRRFFIRLGGIEYWGPEFVGHAGYQWTLLTAYYDGTILRGYLNGELVIEETVGTVAFGSRVRLGHDNGAYDLDGHLGEILLYDSPMTLPQVNSIHRYLTDRYQLPSSHATWLGGYETTLQERILDGYASGLSWEAVLAQGMIAPPPEAWLRPEELAGIYTNASVVNANWSSYQGVRANTHGTASRLPTYHDSDANPERWWLTDRGYGAPFFGGDDYLDLYTPLADEVTIITVYSSRSDAGTHYLTLADNFYLRIQNNTPSIYIGGADRFFGETIQAQRPQLHSFLIGQGSVQGYSSGSKVLDANVATASTLESSPMTLGYSSAGLNGYVAEYLVFPRKLEDSERESVEVYLADKYGLYHPASTWISAFSPTEQTRIHVQKLNRYEVEHAGPFTAANPVAWYSPESLQAQYEGGGSDYLINGWMPQAGYSIAQDNGDVDDTPRYRDDRSEWNFQPVASFDTSDDYLRVTATAPKDYTLFEVFNTHATDGEHIGYWTSESSGVRIASRQVRFYFGNVSYSTDYYVDSRTPIVVTQRREGNSGTAFVNGLQKVSATVGTSGISYIDLSHRDVELNGNIAEFLFFDRALSDDERTEIEIYLADKYGLYHPQADWIQALDSSVQTMVHALALTEVEARFHLEHPALPPGLHRWYRAEDLLGTFGTGQTVSTWADASAFGSASRNGSTITNAAWNGDSGDAPIFRDTVGKFENQPGLEFASSDDFLYMPVEGNQAYTIVSVWTIYEPYGDRILFWSEDSGDGLRLNNLTLSAYFNGGTVATTVKPNDLYLTTFASDGTQGSFRFQGSQVGTRATSGSWGDYFTISHRDVELRGYVGEILVWDRALSAAEILQAELSLADKYGTYHPQAAWLEAFTPEQQAQIHQGMLSRADAERTMSEGPGLGGLLLWYRPEEIANHAEGATFASWSDSSGRNQSVLESNNSYRPRHHGEIAPNGFDAAYFGNNLRLLTSPSNNTLAGDFVIAVLHRPDGGALSGKHRLIGSGTSGNNALYYENGTLRAQIGSTVLNSGFAPTRYSWQLAILERENGVLSLRAQGQFRGSVAVSGSFVSNHWISLGYPSAESANSYIAEAMVLDRSLSDVEMTQLEGYFAEKYGLYHEDADWIEDSGYGPDLIARIHAEKLGQWEAETLHEVVDGLVIPGLSSDPGLQPVVHLRADAGTVLANTDRVIRWHNLSDPLNAWHTGYWGAAPSLVEDALRDLPAVAFETASGNLLLSNLPTFTAGSDYSYFAVVAPRVSEDVLWMFSDGTDVSNQRPSSVIKNTSVEFNQYGNNLSGSKPAWTGPYFNVASSILNQARDQYANARQGFWNDTLVATSANTASLQNSPSLRFTNDDYSIAEFILFDRAVTPTEREAVETYLRDKYFPTFSLDLRSSDETRGTLSFLDKWEYGQSPVVLPAPTIYGGYDESYAVRLRAQPKAGYSFGGWSGASAVLLDDPNNPVVDLTIDQDLTLVAEFVPSPDAALTVCLGPDAAVSANARWRAVPTGSPRRYDDLEGATTDGVWHQTAHGVYARVATGETMTWSTGLEPGEYLLRIQHLSDANEHFRLEMDEGTTRTLVPYGKFEDRGGVNGEPGWYELTVVVNAADPVFTLRSESSTLDLNALEVWPLGAAGGASAWLDSCESVTLSAGVYWIEFDDTSLQGYIAPDPIPQEMRGETKSLETNFLAPADLALMGAAAWFTADSLTLGDGEAVGSWPDSGGGHDALTHQGVPRFVASSPSTGMGTPALYFDGAGLNVSNLALGDEASVFVVFAPADASETDRILEGVDQNWLLGRQGGGFRAYNEGYFSESASVRPGYAHLAFMIQDPGALSRAFLDEASLGEMETDNPFGAVNIGGTTAFLEPFTGEIYEVILFDRAVTKEEESSIKLYLANKYGLYHPNADWIAAFSANAQAEIHANQLKKREADGITAVSAVDLTAEIPGLGVEPAFFTTAAANQSIHGEAPISYLVDLSENRNHAFLASAQSAALTPSPSGQPTLRFSGDAVYQTRNDVFETDTGYEIVFVGAPTGNGSSGLFASSGPDQTNYRLPAFEFSGGTDLLVDGDRLPLTPYDAEHPAQDIYSYAVGSPEDPASGVALYSAKFAWARPGNETLLNGGQLLIGRSHSEALLEGELSAVLVFPRALLQSEREALFAYLEARHFPAYTLTFEADPADSGDFFALSGKVPVASFDFGNEEARISGSVYYLVDETYEENVQLYVDFTKAGVDPAETHGVFRGPENSAITGASVAGGSYLAQSRSSGVAFGSPVTMGSELSVVGRIGAVETSIPFTVSRRPTTALTSLTVGGAGSDYFVEMMAKAQPGYSILDWKGETGSLINPSISTPDPFYATAAVQVERDMTFGADFYPVPPVLISICLEPALANDQARWLLVDRETGSAATPWVRSCDAAIDVPFGWYRVEFTELPGFDTPALEILVNGSDQTWTLGYTTADLAGTGLGEIDFDVPWDLGPHDGIALSFPVGVWSERYASSTVRDARYYDGRESEILSSGIYGYFGDNYDGSNYALRQRAFVYFPQVGAYQFFSRTDDEGRIYVDNQLVASSRCCGGWNNNSGASFTIAEPGWHFVETIFQEYSGGDYMDVEWQLPSGTRQALSLSMGASLQFDPNSFDPSGLRNPPTGQPAILVGDAVVEAGAVSAGDGALRLNGAGLATTADHAFLNTSEVNAITIDLRFKADTVGGSEVQMLYEQGGGSSGFNLYLYDGRLYGGLWEDGEDSVFLSTPVAAGIWQHVTLSFDSHELVLFLGSDEVARQAITSGAVPAHTGDVGIGGVYGDARTHLGAFTGSGLYFTGLIDDLTVYRKAWNQTPQMRAFTGKIDLTSERTLTAVALGDGSVAPLIQTLPGTERFQVTAQAAPGSYFTHWTSAENVLVENESAPSGAFTLLDSGEVTAHFTSENAYTVHIDTGEHGLIAGDHLTAPAQSLLTFRAVAEPGYVFTGWSGANASELSSINEAKASIWLDDDKYLSAIFAPAQDTALQVSIEPLPEAEILRWRAVGAVTTPWLENGAVSEPLPGGDYQIEFSKSELNIGDATYAQPSVDYATVSLGLGETFAKTFFYTERDDLSTLLAGAAGWFRASDLHEFYEEDDPVSWWPNLAGSGNSLEIEAGRGQPLFQPSSFEGADVVEFDGNDGLTSSGNLLLSGSDMTVFVVARGDPDSTHPIVATTGDPAIRWDRGFDLRYSSGSVQARYSRNGQDLLTLASSDPANGRLTCYAFQRGAGATKLWVGGELAAIGSGNQADASGPLYVGTDHASNGFIGHIAEIIVFNGAVEDSQVDAINAYLKDKYEVSDHSLEVAVAHGDVSVSPDATAPRGELLRLLPVPDAGYVFQSWEGRNAGEVMGDGPSYEIRLDSDKELQALFVPLDGASGSLTVNFEPVEIASAGIKWQLNPSQGSFAWLGSGETVTSLPPGAYSVQLDSAIVDTGSGIWVVDNATPVYLTQGEERVLTISFEHAFDRAEAVLWLRPEELAGLRSGTLLDLWPNLAHVENSPAQFVADRMPKIAENAIAGYSAAAFREGTDISDDFLATPADTLVNSQAFNWFLVASRNSPAAGAALGTADNATIQWDQGETLIFDSGTALRHVSSRYGEDSATLTATISPYEVGQFGIYTLQQTGQGRFIFENGTMVGSSDRTTLAESNPLWIGDDGGQNGFQGRIAEVIQLNGIITARKRELIEAYLSAKYLPDETVTLHVSSSAGGAVNPSGTLSVSRGSSVTLTPQPEVGFALSGWNGLFPEDKVDSKTGSVSFVARESRSLRAEFASQSSRNVTVQIEPDELVAGIQWQLVNKEHTSEGKFSGETLDEVSPGVYTVVFEPSSFVADGIIYHAPRTEILVGGSDVDITIEYEAKFTPRMIASLRAWYEPDALGAIYEDGNAITHWPDSSGNGWDLKSALAATMEEDLLGNLPGARFSPTTRLESEAGFFQSNRDHSVILVATRETNANGDIFGTNTQPDQQWDRGLGAYFTDSNEVGLIASRYSSVGVRITGALEPFVSGKFDIFAFDFLTSGTGIYAGDEAVAGSSIEGTIDSPCEFWLGNFNGSHAAFDGVVLEVLVFDARLSASERAEVHDYLRAKYFIHPPRTLEVLVSGEGTVSPEGVTTHPDGTQVRLLAEPVDGYAFSHWSLPDASSLESSGRISSILLDGDKVIQANFVPAASVDLKICVEPTAIAELVTWSIDVPGLGTLSANACESLSGIPSGDYPVSFSPSVVSLGSSVYRAPAVFEVSAGAASTTAAAIYAEEPTPAAFPDLAVWYDIARQAAESPDATAAQLTDYSGSARHAIPSGTQAGHDDFDGHAVLTFTGGESYLTSTAVWETDGSTVFVVEARTTGSANYFVGTNSAQSNYYDIGQSIGYAGASTLAYSYKRVGADAESISGAADTFDVPGLNLTTVSSGAAGKVIFRNGVQVAATSSTYANDRDQLKVGGSSGSPSYQGHLAELILFDRELEASERLAVEAYLERKYLLAAETTVTISSTAGGVTVPRGSFLFPLGEDLSITAIPAANHSFVQWTGPDTDSLSSTTEPTTVLSVDGSKSIQAQFAPIEHTLSVTSGEGGATTPSGTSTHLQGEVVMLTAIPEIGYVFSEWTGASADALADPLANPIEVPIDESKAFTAEFVARNFDLTLSRWFDDGSGTLTYLDEVVSSHPAGAMADVTFEFPAGYTFDRFDGPDAGSIEDPQAPIPHLAMVSDREIRVVFLPVHTVTFSAGEGGAVNPSGEFTFKRGSVVTVTAEPAPYYSFAGWTGASAATLANPAGLEATVEVLADVELIATFALTGAPSAGMRLWLRADAGLAAGPVGSWPDQSGTGNNASQSNASQRPTMLVDAVNGLPVVRFAGNGQSLNLPNVMQGAEAGEILVVTRVDAAASARQGLWNWGADTGEPTYYLANQNAEENFGSSRAYRFPISPQPLTEYHVYGVSAEAGRWTAYQNGRVVHERDVNTVAFRANPVLGLRHPGELFNSFHGDIAEIIVYDRVLTESERGAATGYLLHKYGPGDRALRAAPSPWIYPSPVEVELSVPGGGGDIYYTLDGSPPTPATSALYESPVAVGDSLELRAQAFTDSEPVSDLFVGQYRIGNVPEVVTSLSGLTATYFQGSDFSGDSTRLITERVRLEGPATLPSGWNYSNLSVVWEGELVAQFTETHLFYLYTLDGVRLWVGDLETPLIDDWEGEGERDFEVLVDLVAGERYPIRLEYQRKQTYPLLILMWTGDSTAQNELPLSQLDSGANYGQFAESPEVSPSAGVYPDIIDVSFTAATPGSILRYTLDGSEPTEASPVYAGPFAITASATLKVAAFAGGFDPSSARTVSYQIDWAYDLKDPKLEAALAEYLGLAPGTRIHRGMVRSLTGELDLRGRQIAKINGLQFALGLDSINLDENYLALTPGSEASAVIDALTMAGVAVSAENQTQATVTFQIEPAEASALIRGAERSQFGHGEEVQLDALGGDDYVFSHWEGALTGSENPTILQVADGQFVTAVFEAVRWPLDPPNGMIAWWRADLSATDVVGGLQAVSQGDVVYDHGAVGVGFALDGEDDYLLVSASPATDLGANEAGFSIECWLRNDLTGTQPGWDSRRFLAWSGDGLSIGLGWSEYWWMTDAGSRLITVRSGNGESFDFYEFPEPGEWTHLVVSYDRPARALSAYANGKRLNTYHVSEGLTFDTNGDFLIGAGYEDGSMTFFQGALDEITLYARALVADEVAALFRSGNLGKAGLVGRPTVSAGEDQRIDTFSTTLEGAVSGGFGDTAVAWSLESSSGPNVLLAEGVDALHPVVNFGGPGLFHFLLEVTDKHSLTTDSIIVQVADPSQNAAAAPSGLVGWWSGEGFFDRAGANDAGYTSTTSFGGKVGSAFRFSGDGISSGDFMRLPTYPDVDLGLSEDGFTIEFWWQPGGANWYGGPMMTWRTPEGPGAMLTCSPGGGGEYGWTFSFDADAESWSLGDLGNYGWSISAAPGIWTHLALSFDPLAFDEQLRFYRDGALVNSFSTPSEVRPVMGGDIWIGQWMDGTSTPVVTLYFDGGLDELSIYDRALGAGEVSGIFNAGEAGKFLPDNTPFAGILPFAWQGAFDPDDAESDLVYELQYQMAPDQAWITIFGPEAEVRADPVSNEGALEVVIEDLEDTMEMHLRLRAFDGVDASDWDEVGPIRIDNGPPLNPSIMFEEGAFTTVPTIHALLSAEGAREMLLSQDPDFSDRSAADWMPYAETMEYLLEANPEETVAVHAKFRDLFENESEVVIAEITYLSAPDHVFETDTSLHDDLTWADQNVVIDGATLTVSGDLAFRSLRLINGARIIHPEPPVALENRMRIIVEGSVVVFGDLELTDGASLSAASVTTTGNLSLDHALLITDQVGVSGEFGISNESLVTSFATTATTEHRLLVEATVVTLDASSRIDVGGKGYLAGLTLGLASLEPSMAGGSHGGYGGGSGVVGEVYGDFRSPTGLGSGSSNPTLGGAGGGALRLITQTLTLDGWILADAEHYDVAESTPGGGAGGSIWIEATALAGSGSISASGGRGDGTETGGGGGGRIAVLTHTMTFDPAAVFAYGGDVATGNDSRGGAGTLYFEDRSTDPVGVGTLIVDGGGMQANRATFLRSIGSGIIDGLGAAQLVDTSATFPVPNEHSPGLRHLWVQPDMSVPAYYRIADNDVNSLTVIDDGSFAQQAQIGDSYRGVVRLRELSVRGGSALRSDDPLVLNGGWLELAGGGVWFEPAVLHYFSFQGEVSDRVGSIPASVTGGGFSTDRFEQISAAYNFDGNARITADLSGAKPSNWQNDFFVSAWIRHQSTGTDRRTILSLPLANGTGEAFWFGLSEDTSRLGVGLITSEDVFLEYDTSPLPANAWTQVACFYDQSRRLVSLFVNGERTRSFVIEGDPAWLDAASDTLVIGAIDQGGAPSAPFLGVIDDLLLATRIIGISAAEPELETEP